jgi:hypothetical protein
MVDVVKHEAEIAWRAKAENRGFSFPVPGDSVAAPTNSKRAGNSRVRKQGRRRHFAAAATKNPDCYKRRKFAFDRNSG